MRIAFDHQIFCTQAYGGASRYFVRLAHELLNLNENLQVFAPLYRNSYLSEVPITAVFGRHVDRYPPKTSRIISLYNSLVSQIAIRAWQPEIVHETYYSGRYFGSHRCPTVITILDMIHELFPASYATRGKTTRLKQAAVDKADHVICISENTRTDLVNLFGVPIEKTSVIYLGFERLPSLSVDDCGTRYSRPFLLYVGRRGGYKNFAGFLRAVANSRCLCSDFDVAAFGGSSFSAQETALIRSLGFRNGQVRQISGEDEVLGFLYKNASALVYPSLYEGFGLPILEAMAHNCPVVASNTSSIPEVAGDAAEFFAPASEEDMARAIEQVVYSSERTKTLIHQGAKQIARFSWNKCATETLAVYQRLQP